VGDKSPKSKAKNKKQGDTQKKQARADASAKQASPATTSAKKK
jgi:hypothetical protein